MRRRRKRNGYSYCEGEGEERSEGSWKHEGVESQPPDRTFHYLEPQKSAEIAEFYVAKKRRFRNFEAPKVVKCSVVVVAATRSGSAVKPHGERLAVCGVTGAACASRER